jgi:hypothetical protein
MCGECWSGAWAEMASNRGVSGVCCNKTCIGGAILPLPIFAVLSMDVWLMFVGRLETKEVERRKSVWELGGR